MNYSRTVPLCVAALVIVLVSVLATPKVRRAFEQFHSHLNPYSDLITEMEFFGKVVDEHGAPVPSAEVRFRVSSLLSGRHWVRTTQTGPSGTFELHGAVGSSLSIEIEKSGFYPCQGPGCFFNYVDRYGPTFHQPRPENPVLFSLQKKGTSVPLVWWDSRFIIGIGPVAVDIQSGATNTTGELKLQLVRNRSPSGTNRGSWEMRITMLAGGLQLHTDHYPFTAPLSNYAASIVLNERTAKEASTWSGEDGGTFYGMWGTNYARFALKMVRGSNECHLECVLNPYGLANLELDPKLQPKKVFAHGQQYKIERVHRVHL